MTQPTEPPPGSADPAGASGGLPGCSWHPDRATGLACTRCGRPACPECLREASVGYHCVDCVQTAQRSQRQATTVAGAAVQTRPIVVPILIAVNLAIFAITAAQAGDLLNNFRSSLFAQWQLWPPVVASGEWWRMLTSGFLHYGPLHLAMNMLALWILGRDLEVLLGKLRFCALYALSLLGGGVAVYLFGDMSTAVAGASGAVFGLMGGLVVAIWRLKLNGTQLYVLLAVNLIISFSIPGISMLGHIGGLVIGALCAGGMLFAPRARRSQVQWATVGLLLVLLVALFITRDAMLGEYICPEDGYCYQPSGFGV